MNANVAVEFVCVDGHGRLLLHQRGDGTPHGQGDWDPGAGKVEPDEAPLDTLRRELREEYGFKNFRLIEALPHFTARTSDWKLWICLPHIVLVNPDELDITEPTKVTNPIWFPATNLPTIRVNHFFERSLELYRFRYIWHSSCLILV